MRSCSCHLSPAEINEVNNNPLKIFKNFVSYAGPGAKGNLYYDVFGQESEKAPETVCVYCNQRYRVKLEKYAPCQMIEILDFGDGVYNKKRQLMTLSSNISRCWLIEPFINQVEVGDMICLTAFYFMTPQQRMVDSRCISPLVGSFVAFNIDKVNPFNQMIDADPKLATLFFEQSSRTTRATTKNLVAGTKMLTRSGIDPRRLGLTLANVQAHEQQVFASNRSFFPKVHRLLDLANTRPTNHLSRIKSDAGHSSLFGDRAPVFEALLRMENGTPVP